MFGAYVDFSYWKKPPQLLWVCPDKSPFKEGEKAYVQDYFSALGIEAYYYHWEFPGTFNKWNGFYALIHVHQFLLLESYFVAGSSQDQSPASMKTLSD